MSLLIQMDSAMLATNSVNLRTKRLQPKVATKDVKPLIRGWTWENPAVVHARWHVGIILPTSSLDHHLGAKRSPCHLFHLFPSLPGHWRICTFHCNFWLSFPTILKFTQSATLHSVFVYKGTSKYAIIPHPHHPLLIEYVTTWWSNIYMSIKNCIRTTRLLLTLHHTSITY